MLNKRKLDQISHNEFWIRLVKNVTTVLIGNGGSSVINFGVTLILIHTLGNEEYGIFLLALQYMYLLDGIINFQSWSGVIKYGSEAMVENNNNKLAAILKSGFLIDFVTAAIGTVASFAFLPLIAYLLKWNHELVILAIIFSVEIIFHIEGTSVGILRLFNKFNLTAIQTILSSGVKLLMIGGYVLLGGRNLTTITILYVATDIFKHLILVIMATYVLHCRFGIQKVIKASIKSIDHSFLKYTLWNNLSYTSDVPVKYLDVFIISQISYEMIAIYKVFKQIIQILSMLVQPISMAILPQFSELVAKGKSSEALIKVMKLRNAILGLGTGGIAISLLIGKPVFNLFLGQEYGDNLLLFELILIMQVFFIAYVAVHPFFSSLGVAKADFTITLSSNIIYLLTAYCFVGMFGIYAVVLANAIQGFLCIYLKLGYVKYKLLIGKK